jgi:hypothetical protein
VAGGDIDAAHFHAMLAGRADQLGGSIKAHRLAVEQRRRESGRIVTFQPGGGVDQQGETGRVRFGKTIFAETANLLEQVIGKLFGQPSGAHAFDQLAAKFVDDARPPPGAHGAAQLVGLARGKAGGHHRQPHGLFLKQRHAERSLEHGPDFIVGIRDRLGPRAAAQVGMDHLSLDRSGPNDRHFDHQVVIFARAQPREHGHLGPAFDLKDPDGVGPANHVIDLLVGLRQSAQTEPAAGMTADQFKALAQSGKHSQGEAIDLEDAQLVEIVLVPLDDGAAGHDGVFDRHQFVERSAGDDHAADVLSEMSRKADQRADQSHQPAADQRGGVDAHGLAVAFETFVQPVAFQVFGQAIDSIGRQAECLADVAGGHARAIGDDFGGHAGPIAAIFFVQILQHLLAALVLKIDVDVGRLVPLATDKTLEQGLQSIGIDRRDFQAIADDRIGRRTASLTKNAALSSETNQVEHREKISLVAQLPDQLQLVLDQPHDPLGNTGRIAPLRSAPSQPREISQRRFARRRQLLGIFVTQLVERKGRTPGNAGGVGQCGGLPRKPRSQGLERLQMTLGIRKQPATRLVYGFSRLNGQQDVGQRRAIGRVIVDVAGGHQRQMRLVRPQGQTVEPLGVVTIEEQFGQQVAAVAEASAIALKRIEIGQLAGGTDDAGQQAFGVSRHVRERNLKLSFGCPSPPQGDQPRQPAVRGPIGGPQDDGRRIVGRDFGADHQRQTVLPGGGVRPHHAGQRVAVGNGQRLVAQGDGLGYQLVGMRGSFEKREIRFAMQFRVGEIDGAGRRRGRIGKLASMRVEFRAWRIIFRSDWSGRVSLWLHATTLTRRASEAVRRPSLASFFHLTA